MKQLALLISTFGYVGFFPIAPGTAGSLAALALYAAVRWVGEGWFEIGVIAAVLAAGVWSATESERLLGASDPGPVVIDEVLGLLVTLAFMPLSLWGVGAGFLVFRALDVVKPFPAAALERLHGGWGVMLDDAAAGLYGQSLLRLLTWVAPQWLLA